MTHEVWGLEASAPPKATTFNDMHSGGGSKENHELIVIEAPEAEAICVFYSRFGHNPERISCSCCGSDYSIWEHDSLDEALGIYKEYNEPLVIRAGEIDQHERNAYVPVQGWTYN